MGSARAEKMLYDESNAALDEIRMSDLEIPRGASQLLIRNDLRRERLSLVTCPLADTSTG